MLDKHFAHLGHWLGKRRVHSADKQRGSAEPGQREHGKVDPES